MTTKQSQAPDPALEGEGNRSADRHYRDAATEYAKSDASKRAAADAERAIDGDEREELERAEAAGKARARTDRTSLAEGAEEFDDDDDESDDEDDNE